MTPRKEFIYLFWHLNATSLLGKPQMLTLTNVITNDNVLYVTSLPHLILLEHVVNHSSFMYNVSWKSGTLNCGFQDKSYLRYSLSSQSRDLVTQLKLHIPVSETWEQLRLAHWPHMTPRHQPKPSSCSRMIRCYGDYRRVHFRLGLFQDIKDQLVLTNCALIL